MTEHGLGENKKYIKCNCDDITRFLEIFKNYELLWNLRHNDYVDSQKRESLMHRLLDGLQQQSIVVPDVTFCNEKLSLSKQRTDKNV